MTASLTDPTVNPVGICSRSTPHELNAVSSAGSVRGMVIVRPAVLATRPRQRSKVANVATNRITAIPLRAKVQESVAGQYFVGSGEIPESVTPHMDQKVPKKGLPIYMQRAQTSP